MSTWACFLFRFRLIASLVAPQTQKKIVYILLHITRNWWTTKVMDSYSRCSFDVPPSLRSEPSSVYCSPMDDPMFVRGPFEFAHKIYFFHRWLYVHKFTLQYTIKAFICSTQIEMPWRRRLRFLSASDKRNLTTRKSMTKILRDDMKAKGFMSNNRKLKAPQVLSSAADFPATNYVILVFISRRK